MNQQQQTTEFVEDVQEQSYAQPPQKAKLWDKIVNVLLIVVIAVLLVTVVYKSFFVTNVEVSGDSMLPTYNSGTIVKVDRTANQNTIFRGDVVVFYINHPGWLKEHFNFFSNVKQNADDQYRLLIKRVVAVQGDQIWVEQVDGQKDTYRIKIKTANGDIVGENYVVIGEKENSGTLYTEDVFYIVSNDQHDTLQRLKNFTKDNPYTVPQGYFFAMGDNRSNSHDSRYADLGDISYDNVFGKVLE